MFHVIRFHVSFEHSNFRRFMHRLPLIFLSLLAPPIEAPKPAVVDPCVPSPCGPYSQCRAVNGAPSCSCRPTYIGSPPNCRPECISDSDCGNSLACVRQKCTDPCPGSCGIGATCHVTNHVPSCVCLEGYIGNPFIECRLKPPVQSKNSKLDFYLISQKYHLTIYGNLIVKLSFSTGSSNGPLPAFSLWTKCKLQKRNLRMYRWLLRKSLR